MLVRLVCAVRALLFRRGSGQTLAPGVHAAGAAVSVPLARCSVLAPGPPASREQGEDGVAVSCPRQKHWIVTVA